MKGGWRRGGGREVGKAFGWPAQKSLPSSTTVIYRKIPAGQAYYFI